ncbi:hypothetical protein MWL02_14840 [Escherichia coli]|nr:hypothetical protein [Escherichia coli]
MRFDIDATPTTLEEWVNSSTLPAIRQVESEGAAQTAKPGEVLRTPG